MPRNWNGGRHYKLTPTVLSITRPKYVTIIVVPIAVDFCTKGNIYRLQDIFVFFAGFRCTLNMRSLAVCRSIPCHAYWTLSTLCRHVTDRQL